MHKNVQIRYGNILGNKYAVGKITDVKTNVTLYLLVAICTHVLLLLNITKHPTCT